MDCWYEISTYIPNRSWKNFIFTCKSFYSLNIDEEVDKRSNHLETIVNMHLWNSWTWKYLSSNPAISCEFIVENRFELWSWGHVMLRDYISRDLFEILFEECYTYELYQTGHISIYHVLDKIRDFNEWDIGYISSDKQVTLGILDMDYEWDWNSASDNPNLTIDYVKNNNHSWSWFRLTQNESISLSDIMKNPDLPWEFDVIGRRSDFSWDFVEKNLDWVRYSSVAPLDIIETHDLLWDWQSISWNPKVTCEFIDRHIDKDWDWKVLSCLNMESWFVKKYKDRPWDWYTISKNNTISWKFIYENKLPWVIAGLSKRKLSMSIVRGKEIWDWSKLSRNLSISLSNIEENPDIPWDWKEISRRSDLTWRFMEKNMYRLDLFNLSKNKFTSGNT